ncbi:biotin-dependent carboxyltransferase family protein [Poseidonocella sedimentorum]|uniref:Allophanate hydrolase subunit 2 n=1 Tax=Poseidonocella sedimentorum TaxID=871652 RepID=A0A1I6D492_9RHOB|nr:biotin-dependent carboxyltransferase family protein [Poseidonocella sedimentorum]SFR00299.1 Allophanate hydrolase subunit 2 [Poseidonocella sedimentorum]
MSAALTVHRIGPAASVQDGGRPGLLASGLARGGALDRRALAEAAALLGARSPLAGLELPGTGGAFSVDAPITFALTGAPMAARIDGRALAWSATHRLHPGEGLEIGAVRRGAVGYLTPAGSIDSAPLLGSRSAHIAAGLGRWLAPGDSLPCATAPGDEALAGRLLSPEDRFSGGVLRVLPGPQTGLFPAPLRAAFAGARFRIGPRTNRQAAELLCPDWQPNHHAGDLVSDIIGPGDIQITGDGTPFVLLAECQTIGGYPRIGTVHPADLPTLVQSGSDAALSFRFTAEEDAPAWVPEAEEIAALARRITPLRRDPATMPDLLSYQLISGVTAGDDA